MGQSGLYRRLVESSAEGLWALDDAGRTVYANHRLAEMLGVPREQMIGRDHADFLDADGRAQWVEHLAQLESAGDAPITVDCRFVRADGVGVWFLVSEARLRDDDGTPSGVLLSLSEFDDRRRLESELEDSRRELLEAQRLARLGSWSYVAASGEITVSPTVGEFVAPATARVSDAGTLLDAFPPTEVDRLMEAVQPVLDDAEPSATFEVSAPGHDGPVWLRIRASGLRAPDGTVVGLTGSVQDVTDSRVAADALRDHAHQNLLMQRVAVAANESRTLVDALTAVGELLVGHDDWRRAQVFWPTDDEHADLVAGPSIGHAAPGDDSGDDSGDDVAERELHTARRAQVSGRPEWDEVDRLTLCCPVLLDGRVVAVVAITSDPPLYRHDLIAGMVQQVVVQLSTVAEREATARELATARDAAMEASRQKSEFLATMSHEIRTPLNGVIGLNDLLRATTLDPHQHRLASGVAVSGRALLGIVDDILDFSKIEAGLLEIEDIEVDPRQVLDDVAAMVVQPAADRRVEVVVHADRDVPGLVRGDRVRLTQVVSNLVSNAVKFSEDGVVGLRLTCAPDPDRPLDDARALLRVEVSDTGVGIAPERVASIFDPFVQADTSTTREFGGTGLGLAIVREIVTAMGGEVGLESELGVGSTFWFTARVAVARPAAEDRSPVLSGRSAWVVDACPTRRDADAERLAHWGMRVHTLAPEDVDLRAARPDVVLLSGDGAALADEAGPGPLQVPVVRLADTGAVTEVTDPATATVHRVERPLTSSHLREALESAITGQRAPRDTAPAGQSGAEAPGPPVVPTTGRARVLVVEDTPVNQLVAEGMLTALGYRSESVDDGIQALERLAQDGPRVDLVLMDVQMPRLDGYATSRAIRERERESGTGRLPIVAMTAAAVVGERERCLDAGMDDFVTKPVSPARLATVLSHHLAGATETAAGPPPDDSAATAPSTDTGPAGAPVPDELLPHLDVERLDMLRDLDPGNTAYVDRVIGNFVTRTPGLAETIREAVATDDSTALTATAHRLLGSALNLGVPRVAAVARELESIGDSGDLRGADVLTAELDAAVERGRVAVLAYRASYGGS